MLAKLRALLVDDHPVVQVGLRLALEDSFALCGEARDVAEARRLVEEHRPDLIVLDLSLGGRDGPELIEDLLVLHPATRILVFSSLLESTYALRALRAGAFGYVMKSQGLERVAAALHQLARGEYAFSDSIQQALLAETSRRPTDTSLDALSNRELQILRLLGAGLGTAEIAAELHLGLKTIGTYRERLKNKLSLQSARELEQFAASHARQAVDFSSP